MSSAGNLTLDEALQLAQRAMAGGQAQQAEAILQRILAVHPKQPQALHVFGRLALQTSRPELAAEMFGESASQQPAYAPLQMDLGNAYLMLGRLTSAAEAYRRFLSLEPNHPGAWSNLGVALHEMGSLSEALEAFQKALDLAPDVADRHNNLATALISAGRLSEAVKCYEHASALDPSHLPTQNNLANALKETGEVSRAVDLAREIVLQHPTAAQAHGNLLLFLQYDIRATAEEIFLEHRKWNAAHAISLTRAGLPHSNDRSPHRRLKIGYFSPDLREHSVPFFFEGLLESHNSSRVETFCYADLLRKPDATSDRLQALSHHWRNVTGLGDENLAEIIRKDQIDILVDLAGFTAGGRMLLFARKAAPVQVSYIGYPSTTGLDAMDYCLTDGFLDPPGSSEHLFSEKLFRLPRTFACYKPPFDAPPINSLPAIANEFVTFGSFNNFAKVNENVIAAWAKILSQTANSRLLIGARGMDSPPMADRVREKFAKRGIRADRLEFTGYTSQADYLKAHHRADIILDTFPVNGHTVTCHALWMGVPTITLAGDRHNGRLGSSVLHNVGLTNFLANSVEEYVAIALSLTKNLTYLQSLRATLRERMLKSPLLDFPAVARCVEEAYQSMWQSWCAE